MVGALARAGDEPGHALRPGDHLRPARLWPVRPVLGSAHARGADGRRAGGDGRRRRGARGHRGHARGRPAGGAVRRHLSRARERAHPLRHVRAGHLGTGLRVGLVGRGARPEDGRARGTLGRGPRGGRRGAQRGRRPVLHGVGGPARAPGRQPGHDPPHLRPDRRVRRPRRAALDPGAHARDAPSRRRLHQDRALALHRLEHPRRPLRGARRSPTTCSRWATPRR